MGSPGSGYEVGFFMNVYNFIFVYSHTFSPSHTHAGRHYSAEAKAHMPALFKHTLPLVAKLNGFGKITELYLFP